MSNVFIFHGTEGYPEENWFPWMKGELEKQGYTVVVPQFPSPPIVPAKIEEWFDVFRGYEQFVTPETVFIGHSLGGLFLLRVLETLPFPVAAACFVGTPIGVLPIANYPRDVAFTGFDFDWEKLREKSRNFIVFQSDDDPYVSLGNGQELAKNLGVELDFVPHAGHFNTRAGYTQFPQLLEKVTPLIQS